MNHFSEWYKKNGHNVLFVYFFCKFSVPLLYTGFIKKLGIILGIIRELFGNFLKE